MITWKLNGTPLDQLGLTLASGEKTSHGPSRMMLQRDCNFDAARALAYLAPAVLTWSEDGGADTVYFRGKCMTAPAYGSPDAEGHTYEIADAWAEMETTIYQESWGYGELLDEEDEAHVRADRQVPRAIFGLNAAGAKITVGQQIRNAISYAASCGISIAIGSVPDGEIPLQVELRNVSVAEVIAMALRFHPDWIPFIDHAPTVPVFHVLPVSAMDAVNLPLDGSGTVKDFDVRDRSDLIPAAVRMVYEFAGEANVDGEPEIFRKAVIDKFPLDGPDEGPRVLVAYQQLAGGSAQVQKAPLHVVKIPVAGDDSEVDAKAWVKMNWPHLAEIPDAELNVTGLRRKMLPEPFEFPDPINPEALRIEAIDDPDKYPRQLLRGTVEDWMRVRVGRMLVQARVVPTGTATEETKKKLRQALAPKIITATSGKNKIYHGPSQWVAPEDVPVGIAAAVYNSIVAGVRWQGSVTLEARDIPRTAYLGKVLNLTGSANAELDEMAAPITAISWDLDMGSATLTFGPLPSLAPNDFLELQRILRERAVKWYSADERIKEKPGAEKDPSAAGDSVGGFDQPENTISGGTELGPFFPTVVSSTEGGVTVALVLGYLCEIKPGTDDAIILHKPSNMDASLPMTVGQQVSLQVSVDENALVVPPVSLVVEAEDEDSVHYRPIAGDDREGVAGTMKYKLAVCRAAGENPEIELFLAGSHVYHFRDIPLIENTVPEPAEGIGRVLKKIEPADGKIMIRSLTKADGQLRVDEDGDLIKLRGNNRKLTLKYQIEGESPVDVLQTEDGLEITGTPEGAAAIIPIPKLGGKNLNVHIMTQGEGTSPDGWVRTPTAVQTLVWRNGVFRGAFEQASPSAYSEIFTEIEEAAPGDLISVRVSRINGVS